MTQHHFVPLFVIRSFASPDAWRLVDDVTSREQTRLHDQRIISRGVAKKLPICVYDKSCRRLTRRRAGQVCSHPNLYRFLDHEDHFVAGLLRYHILDGSVPIRTVDDLRELGASYMDPNIIESQKVGRIDSEFAGILNRLRGASPVSLEEAAVVKRFLLLARFRTVAFRRHQYPVYRERLLQTYHAMQQDARVDPHIGELFVSIYERLDEHIYPILINTLVRQEAAVLDKVNAKIEVLRASGGIHFVTCDNPARPYRADRVGAISTGKPPPFSMSSTQITFPIDPEICIRLSTRANIPAFSRKSIGEKEIRRINTALALMADEQVVLPSPSTNCFMASFDIWQCQRPSHT